MVYGQESRNFRILPCLSATIWTNQKIYVTNNWFSSQMELKGVHSKLPCIKCMLLASFNLSLCFRLSRWNCVLPFLPVALLQEKSTSTTPHCSIIIFNNNMTSVHEKPISYKLLHFRLVQRNNHILKYQLIPANPEREVTSNSKHELRKETNSLERLERKNRKILYVKKPS